jgi:hypothetical protein
VPLRALGGTALVTVVAWGAYEWASSTGHGTIGMIAGILLVPAGLALAGLVAVTLTMFTRRALGSAAARRRARRADSGPEDGPPSARATEDVARLTARDHVAA